MSQTSNSSCKSSESRNWVTTTSSPDSLRKSQRRRSTLTLKRKYLELSNQSSSESITRYDTRSIDSCSIASTPPETNSSISEYATLAKQYGISIESAKKFYSILTGTSQVPVIRTVSIKQEPVSPDKILPISPTFGSKKRRRRTKIKVELNAEEQIDSSHKSVLSQNARRNIDDYFATLSDVNIKLEPNLDNSVQEYETLGISENGREQWQNQDFIYNENQSQFRNNSFCQINAETHQPNFDQSQSKIKRFSNSYNSLTENSEFTQNSSQTSCRSTKISSQKKKQKLKQSNLTSSKTPFSNKWKELIDSSGDEFEVIRSNINSPPKSTNNRLHKNAKKKSKKTELVTNPFSKIKKNVQSSQDLKRKNKSFWKKKFGHDDDPIKRKKKFIQTFMKRDNESNETNELSEYNSKIQSNKIDVGCLKTAQENDNDNELASIDSLSVNCQYFNSNVVKTTISRPTNSCTSSPLLSFGADPYDCEQNTSINENICDSNVNLSKDTHEMQNNDNNLEEEENTLNDSFLSLDLIESPTKYEDIESNVEYEEKKTSIPQPKIIETVHKPRVKPKIISDSKLPNNSIVISSFENVGAQTLRLNSKIVLANQPQCASIEKSNGIDDQIINSPPSLEPAFNGMPKTRTLDYKVRQQNKETDGPSDNIVEESFDSLCQDITELSSNHDQPESITLYNGNDLGNADFEVLSSSIVGLKNEQFKTPNYELLNSDSKEKSVSTSRISPITFKRNSRLSLSLKSLNELKIKKNTISEGTKEKALLSSNTSAFKSPITCQGKSKQILSLKSSAENMTHTTSSDGNKKFLPNPSNSISRKSPIIFQSTSLLSTCSKPPSTIRKNIISTKVSSGSEQNLSQSTNPNKIQQTTSPIINSFSTCSNFVNNDSGLNRSLSPVKSINASRDPRLNRSNSPLKTPIDARVLKLNSSSPTGVNSTEKSPDPRLRKRKEREDNEKIILQKREINFYEQENNVSNFTRDVQEVSQQNLKKTSVFNRLGRKKSPSPKKYIDVTKELLDIVKGAKSRPINSYDTDDEDNMSLHPGNIFSSDEESNASPPHRKFTSERMRVNEQIRNKPISVKDRLTWKNSAATSTIMPTTTELKLNRKINRITFNTNTSEQSQPVKGSVPTIQPLNQINSMAAYAAQCRQIPFNTYGKNDSAFNEQFYKNNSAALNDKFYKMNTAQMLKDVDNLSQFGSTPNVTFGNSSVQAQTSATNFNTSNTKNHFFKAFCYRALNSGNCPLEMTACHFSHHIQSLQKLIVTKKIDLLLPILDEAIRHKFVFFLQNVWNSILPILNLEAFNMYNKLYQAGLRSDRFLNELLDFCLRTKLHTVESFVKKLALFVDKDNKDWVRTICVSIKAKMTDGFCWETIKCLSQKAVPPVDMIELTILQCLKRKKNLTHISEVYDLVQNKLTNLERNRMSQTMLTQFHRLVQKLGLLNSKEVLNTVPITNVKNDVTENSISPSISRCQSVESIRSAETDNQNLIVNMSPAIRKNKVTSPLSPLKPCNTRQPNESPLEVQIRTPNKGESTNFPDYSVKELESGEPTSAFKSRFWKLYLAVTNVDQGLDHEDYDYVWKILHEFSKQDIDDSLLKRAYYHILCKKVKSCERHLSEIIKRAVHNRRPTSQKCLNLLFEVGVCALIDLANSELWIMALNLLNAIKIIEPNEPRTVFVLICAEIYLANNDPLEALYLLQRTRLIRTNRDEWLTKDHTKDHEKHRNKVVIILLRALSYADPDKAVYLFKALLVDQYIDYYPVDLRLYLDNLILLLLLHDQDELIADVCRLIIKYDLTFQRATYRELITRMLPIDEVLTNQILDYAINLGYYNDIQIRNNVTSVIIDTNCTEEELYLILKRLMHVLVLNIGPGIDRLTPNKLKVMLIFEDIPIDKRLYRNEIGETARSAYVHIYNQVGRMLTTRFSPSIRLSKVKTSKVCKLVSRTVIDYLKHWS